MNDNKINIQLSFKEYEFRRVKHMGNNATIYTTGDWINKLVLIIPVPYNITDRYIEAQYDEEKDVYTVGIESDTIIKKKVSRHKDIGRMYVPKELCGLDCIIIEAPYLDNF